MEDFAFFQLIDNYLETHLATAPFAIFGLLILAGFFIPISEDLMILLGGLLAARHPEIMPSVFVAIVLGAYTSDVICYALMGRYLGSKLFQTAFFSRMLPPQKLEKIQLFYKRYGIPTLFFGRFIPFGVRNALFFSAGLSKMGVLKFMLTDFLACLLNALLYFTLYYQIGKSVLESVETAKQVLLALTLLVVLAFLLKKYFVKFKAH